MSRSAEPMPTSFCAMLRMSCGFAASTAATADAASAAAAARAASSAACRASSSARSFASWEARPPEMPSMGSRPPGQRRTASLWLWPPALPSSRRHSLGGRLVATACTPLPSAIRPCKSDSLGRSSDGHTGSRLPLRLPLRLRREEVSSERWLGGWLRVPCAGGPSLSAEVHPHRIVPLDILYLWIYGSMDLWIYKRKGKEKEMGAGFNRRKPDTRVKGWENSPGSVSFLLRGLQIYKDYTIATPCGRAASDEEPISLQITASL